MPKKSGTGIIVGRFQVFELNALHRKLIGSVRARHNRTLIFLSSNPAPSTYNPLDWDMRCHMFQENYHDALSIQEMPDLPDDRIWSQELDRRIMELRPEGKVMLYGTEAGFTSRYTGRYPTKVLEKLGETFLDEVVPEGLTSARDFRAGIMYGLLSRFPTVYPTVDLAVVRDNYREVLLARKENETRWRFPGGFADPSDENFEMAALRELMEECGEIQVQEMVYLGSYNIDDWRYRFSMDTVMTHFYLVHWEEGEPQAQDDIAEVRWFELPRLRAEQFVLEHQPLFEVLKELAERV